MPKLIPKYQHGTTSGWTDIIMSAVQSSAPELYSKLSNIGSISNPNNNTFASTTSTPPYVVENAGSPGSSGGSSTGGGSFSTSGTGFNLKNQAMGMAANYIGQAVGQQIGGKYGDEIGQLGSIVGQNLLTNGNLKGLFTGGSGAALGGIGYNVLNKAMGGDKNKDFGSKMLTNLGGMAFAINPVLGAAVTGAMVVNNLTGKSTQKYEGNSFQSQEMQADLGGSYGSSMEDLKRARDKAGHYGGIARLTGEYSRARNRVQTGNDTLTAMQQIYDDKQLGKIRGQNMADINSLDYRLNTFGGYDQYGTVIGRKGMKLPSKQDIDRIKGILEFKKGGQMNVIPEGALHARLHHMETENKITKKGIPVIDKNGEQQAEIERNEIIFSLEVTNKLEELRKDGSDKAALEAGKLLVDEIFHNTDDRTGLIQEVIGTDEAKKGVFKEGGIIAEAPIFTIQAEEPEIEKFQRGGEMFMIPPDRLQVLAENAPYGYPTYEEYIEQERIKAMERAADIALQRKMPYNMKGLNCIATALDNYREFGVPIVTYNPAFYADPEKYGFRYLSDFDYNYDNLPRGALVQDMGNEEKNTTSNEDFPTHMTLFQKHPKDTEDNEPRFSWSSGHYTASDVKRSGHYPFIHSTRPNGSLRREHAYTFIGTDEWNKQKREEYNKLYPQKKFQNGGIIVAEEPEMDSDEDEPVGIEEVEYFQTGGIIAEMPDGSDDEEEDIEEYQEGGKSKRKSKNLVIPNFLKYNESEDYYEPNLEFTYDKTWFNTEDGRKFLEKYQEEKTNNGSSVRFTKRKKSLGGFGGEYQPTEDFFDGTEIMFNGIPVKPINEFEIDGQQKYVDQKGQTYTLQPVNQQYKNGGIIEQLNKLSPDKLKELENILKYLNHD